MKMHHNKVRLFSRMCLTGCIFLLVSSCGIRKAETELQKARMQKLEEQLLKVENDIRTNVLLTKRANTTILEPIDETKPSTFNGVEFQNTKATIKEQESDSIVSNTDNTVTTERNSSQSDITTKDKKKVSESERGDPWRTIGLPVGIGLGVALILFVVFKHKK